MNSRKQPQYKKYESSFERKATIADRLSRRQIIERSEQRLNTSGEDEDFESDWDDEYEVDAYKSWK